MFGYNPIKELENSLKRNRIILTKSAKKFLSEDFFSLYPIVERIKAELLEARTVRPLGGEYRAEFSGEITIKKGDVVIGRGKYTASPYPTEFGELKGFKYQLTFLDTPTVEDYSQAVFWEIEVNGKVFCSYRIGIKGWYDDFLRDLSALNLVVEPNGLVFSKVRKAERILERFLSEKKNEKKVKM